MSTILDALRKVAEDNRARNADARTRLLFSSARPGSRPSRQKRATWVIGAGLVFAGFAAGAGLILWGPHSPSPQEERAAGETVLDDKGLKPLGKPPEPLAQATGETPPPPPPTPAPVSPAPSPPPPAAVTSPSPSLPAPVEPPAPPLASAAPQQLATARERPVQRSPFVTDPRERVIPPNPAPAAASELPQPPAGTAPDLPASAPAAPTAEASTPASANTSLSFLQWSPEPDKRLAFIKVHGGPLTLAHEGDTVAGFTVVEIRPDAVDLRAGETSITLRME
jgi:hypothetical protein